MGFISPWLLCILVQVFLYNGANAVVPTITKLDVQCAQSGMTVNVEFDTPFNGIIFSKGHYSNPSCRYVNARSTKNSYGFVIPMASCGTLKSDGLATGTVGFQNTIIFQNDDVVQEIWDSARKISCDWTTRFDKFVTFNPYAVDMLNVQEVAFKGDKVDCWMDLQKGKGPFANPVSGIVQIGDALTIVIYIRDEEGIFDVGVKDCYAYDSPDYESPDTRTIQLTDTNGCTLKEKLFEAFYTTKETRNTGASIIAYGLLNAFKFPDKNDVFLACNVEICKGSCANRCLPGSTGAESSVKGERINEGIPNTILITPEPATTARPITRRVTFAPTQAPARKLPPSPVRIAQAAVRITQTAAPQLAQVVQPRGKTSPRREPSAQNLPNPITVLPPGSNNLAEPRATTRRPLPPPPSSGRANLAEARGNGNQDDHHHHHKANAFHAFHGEIGRFRTRIGGRKRRDLNLEPVVNEKNATVHFMKSYVVVSPDDFPELRAFDANSVCLPTGQFTSGLVGLIVFILLSTIAAVYFFAKSKRSHKSIVSG